MRSPQALRNGENPSPHRRNSNFSTPSATPHHPASHFHSTVTVHKLRRFNSLILLFRLAAFCFSLTSSVFMITTNSRSSSSPHWYDFDAFRFVLAANAIVALYSLFEMVASVWEISRDTTLFPESLQVLAYLLLSANSAGTEMARTLRNTATCTATNAFCVQSDISIALGFAGFLFLGFSSLLSGFRVVCFIINGSRFHL
ncbi:hypothetical protein ACJW30_06G164000 [Castanea mollissima]